MPSGSHRGIGGSHGGSFGGSGGSHDRGGGSHGPAGGGFHRGPRVIMFFGHPHYISSAKGSWISVLSMFAILAGFVPFVMIVCNLANNGQIRKIEEDYQYYQNMIERAETNPDYKKEATITGQFCLDGYQKWYLTYTIEQDNGELLEGDTYSIYTLEDLKKYPIDTVVYAAVDSKTVKKTSDSILMDYKNTTLLDDYSYVLSQKSRTIYIVVMIVDVLVLVGILVAIVMLIQKSAASEEQEKQRQEELYRKCPYCGAKVKNTRDKCPNCASEVA